MQNTILRKNKEDNLLIFDLKGNTRNRKLGPKEIGTKKRFWMKKLHHKKAVFRDLNFVEMNKDLKGGIINLSDEEIESLNETIKKDSLFLEQHSLMDYSLLLAIESQRSKLQYPFHNSWQKQNRNAILSTDNNRYFFIGIIDYLQDYNLLKKVERSFKQLTAEDKIKSVAAAPPKLYAKRFSDFLRDNVFIKNT